MPLHVGALLLQVSLSVSVFRGGGGRGVRGGGTFRLLSLLWQYPVLVFTKSVNSWFSHDVTKIQTKKLSVLLSFYFHVILKHLKTFKQTNFRFKRVLCFAIQDA